MTTSDAGISLITSFEVLSLKPYKCPSGKWTIGYGTRITAEQAERWKGGITRAEATELFRAGLSRHERYVEAMLRVAPEQGAFDAMVSLCYNAGPGNLRKSGVVDLVNESKPCLAAVRLSCACVRGGGKILRGLVNRRYREACMMAEGKADALKTIRENLMAFYRDNWPDKQQPA